MKIVSRVPHFLMIHEMCDGNGYSVMYSTELDFQTGLSRPSNAMQPKGHPACVYSRQLWAWCLATLTNHGPL